MQIEQAWIRKFNQNNFKPGIVLSKQEYPFHILA